MGRNTTPHSGTRKGETPRQTLVVVEARQARTHWSHWIPPLVVGLFTVAILAATLRWQIRAENARVLAQYMAEAEATWPKLTPFGQVKLDTLKARVAIAVSKPHEGHINSLDAYARISLRNDGPTPARVLAAAVVDFPVGNDSLRQIMRDPNRDIPSEMAHDAELTAPLCILPGDSDSIAFRVRLRLRPNRSSSLLHLLVLYQSVRRKLYDTYCWIPYEYPPDTLKLPAGGLYFGQTTNVDSAPISLDRFAPDFYIYTPSEAKIVLSKLGSNEEHMTDSSHISHSTNGEHKR